MTYPEDFFLEDDSLGDLGLELSLGRGGLTTKQLFLGSQLEELPLSVDGLVVL